MPSTITRENRTYRQDVQGHHDSWHPREGGFERFSLEYTEEISERLAYLAPCGHCEFGTRILRIADYRCPAGRHDVAVILDTPGIAFKGAHFFTKEARCWASKLEIAADLCTATSPCREQGRAQGRETEAVTWLSPCNHCGLGTTNIWVGIVRQTEEQCVVINFDFVDVPPVSLTCSATEARCLAEGLNKQAAKADEATKMAGAIDM
jgi:hypothetical protein